MCSKYDSVRDIRIIAITVDEPSRIIRHELCVPFSRCGRLATLVPYQEERSIVGHNSGRLTFLVVFVTEPGPDPTRVRNLAV
ncbi:hypothetical protein GB937_004501 [Aspergillus fischeri]|nr:hypothetical protein GB937_004501 [Aspergillus fischeri]